MTPAASAGKEVREQQMVVFCGKKTGLRIILK